MGLAVAAICRESRGRYGSPRSSRVRERGQRTGRKRVARLMQTAGLRAREHRRFRCTTNSGAIWRLSRSAGAAVYSAHSQPRLVTDITYVWSLERSLYWR